MALGLTLALLLPTFVWSFNLPTVSETIPNGHSIIVHGDRLLMPNKWGTVQSSFQGSSKTVVLIQDLHCNYEVQNNILHMLNYLHRHYGFKLLGQEGAWGSINYDVFRDFHDRAIREVVTDFFMKQGRMTGADVFAANSNESLITVGVESAPLYRKSLQSVQAFLNAEPQGLIMDLQERLREVKNTLFQGPLKTLEEQAQHFRQGKTDIYAYAAFLQKTGRRLGLDKRDLEVIDQWIHRSPQKLTDLTTHEKWSLALRRLESRVRERLYTRASQREADQWDQRLELLTKMFNISATPQEVTQFRSHRQDFRLRSCLTFLEKFDSSQHMIALDDTLALERYLDQVEAFYRLADERSRCFVDNLEAWMAKTGQQSAVMINGGFHNQAIEAVLKARNISFISIRPRFNSTSVVNPYFDILQNRSMPVEKLLEKNQTVLAVRNSMQKSGNTLRTFALYLATLARFEKVDLHDYLPTLANLGLSLPQPLLVEAGAGQLPSEYKLYSEKGNGPPLLVMVGRQALGSIQSSYDRVVTNLAGKYWMAWFGGKNGIEQAEKAVELIHNQELGAYRFSQGLWTRLMVLRRPWVWWRARINAGARLKQDLDEVLAPLVFTPHDDLNKFKLNLGINYNREMHKLQFALECVDESDPTRAPQHRLVTWETALPPPGALQKVMLGEMKQVRTVLGRELNLQVRIDAAGLLHAPLSGKTGALRAALWRTDTVLFYPNDLPDYAMPGEPSTNPFSHAQTAQDAAQAAGRALYVAAEEGYINPQTDEIYIHPLADKADYRKALGWFRYWALKAIAALYIKLNLSLVFVNTATFAGGVAIMRHENLRFLRMLGVDVHWLVIQPRPRTNPYLVTKQFHNNLQGVSQEELTEQNKATLVDFNAFNEPRVKRFIQEHQDKHLFFYVDDPQPSLLVPFLARLHMPILWRSHIQLDSAKMDDPDQPNARYGEFLADAVSNAGLMVFQEKEGTPKVFDKFKGRMLQMYPARDWFGLNKPRTKALAAYYGQRFNRILQDQGGQTALSLQRPIILQKARFDPAKAYEDAINAFYLLQKQLQPQRQKLEAELERLQARPNPRWLERRHIAALQREINQLNPQLVLEGNVANDDPDVYAIYTLCQLKAQGMSYEYYTDPAKLNDFAQQYFGQDFKFDRPLSKAWINLFYDDDPRVRAAMASLVDDIKIVRMPRDDQLLNSLFFLKKLFHVPMVYLQLSHREGFEFNIVEAMLQGIPPIVRNAGGMPAQVQQNRSGFIVDPVPDAGVFSKLVADKMAELLYAPWWKKMMMARAARRFAKTHFHTADLSIKYLLLTFLTLLGTQDQVWLQRFITKLEAKAGGVRQATDELLKGFILFWLSGELINFIKPTLQDSLVQIRSALDRWSEPKVNLWDQAVFNFKFVMEEIFQPFWSGHLDRTMAVLGRFKRVRALAFMLMLAYSTSSEAGTFWANPVWLQGLLSLGDSTLVPVAVVMAGTLGVLWQGIRAIRIKSQTDDTIAITVRDLPGVKHALEHPQESYGQNPYAANPIASLLEKAAAGLFEKPEMVLDILIICGPGQHFHVGWEMVKGERRFVVALPNIYRPLVKADASWSNLGWTRLWHGFLRWSLRINLNAAFKSLGHTPRNLFERERKIKGRQQRFLRPGSAV